MKSEVRAIVVGGSGFVGAAAVAALQRRGVTTTPMRAPRLDPVSSEGLRDALGRYLAGDVAAGLEESFRGTDVVVHAAGDPDASSLDEAGLNAANAVLPAVIVAAAARAGVRRVVHVSSAVVQGRLPTLDASDRTAPFSPYSRSKAAGEALILGLEQDESSQRVIYRPPSVHAGDRRVSRMTARLGRSPLATVASPGTAPTPQALLPNVADAIAFLATSATQPPAVVHHPWEGLTTSGLLEALSAGRKPRKVPESIARASVSVGTWLGGVHPGVSANVRRVEMMWFGQQQAPSWLTAAGWEPPAGIESWARLGQELKRGPGS